MAQAKEPADYSISCSYLNGVLVFLLYEIHLNAVVSVASSSVHAIIVKSESIGFYVTDGDLVTIFDSSDLAFAIHCSKTLKLLLLGMVVMIYSSRCIVVQNNTCMIFWSHALTLRIIDLIHCRV
jgi:hypothetical protein